MFIPNKTFNAMKVGVLGLIAALILVIAGQSVLFVQMQQDNRVALDSLTVRVAKIAQATNTRLVQTNSRQNGTEEDVTTLGRMFETQSAEIVRMQENISSMQTSVNKLLRNECTPETAIYVLTRDMVAVCRSLGVVPE
jgi:uncharacterized protein HemX